ncbi:MAG: outer membrane protein assembly factor [Sphingobacteriia bacterium]|nr:BamA/TamA family outer membrane protein [Paludibacteraceae bacterium]NCA79892.1 outer membrane protein assembly factor [Sphingobacteriia bacterium]
MGRFRFVNIVKLIILGCSLFAYSCSLTKYVPEDKQLLNKVYFKSDIPDLKTDQLTPFLQQAPNSYMFSIMRLELGLYNASGKDTTKWINRWLRKIGEAPIVYDSLLMQRTKDELERELHNKGYYDAEVSVIEKEKKRKVQLTYVLKGNEPYVISRYGISLPDDSVMSIIEQRDTATILKEGQLFDVSLMEQERESITSKLRDRGYYNFQKELLGFTADSANHKVDVVLSLQDRYLHSDSLQKIIFTQKTVGNIYIYNIADAANLLTLSSDTVVLDTTFYQGYCVISDNHKKRIRASVLVAKTFVQPHSLYKESQINKTYEGLNNLQAVKYVNVSFHEAGDGVLDCYIVVSPEKDHSFSVNLEGTNSDGNLGVGVGVSYQNRNIFKGSETLKIGVNGSYEALRKDGVLYNSAEIGGALGIVFPSLLIPASTNFKRQTLGTTEISMGYNFQRRPEYIRNIANIGFTYAWKKHNVRYTFNLLDFSLIYLPWMTDEFREKYLSPSSSVRYSYEDHFIAQIGFGVFYTNQRNTKSLANYYSIRGGVQTAGNLLYGLSNLFGQEKIDGSYEIFHIPYSQYVKCNFDFSYNQIFNNKVRLVWHTALGVGFPYGNATILPFEERFFSGGANSLRGWSVRSLGPGSYKNTSGYIDYMNQSGDIKLDLNVEARFKLFWKLEGAAFIDAGNIWTIKEYAEQPNGQFQWNEFYKQIGCSYGIGLRLNFDFFIIRVDMGLKLYDPCYETREERWRSSFNWKDDVAFHFAVGYPF